MTFREQFEKKMNIDSLAREDELNHAMAWMYIQWLEEQIPIREQAAWDAALKWDSDNEAYYYHDIEEWREER